METKMIKATCYKVVKSVTSEKVVLNHESEVAEMGDLVKRLTYAIATYSTKEGYMNQLKNIAPNFSQQETGTVYKALTDERSDEQYVVDEVLMKDANFIEVVA